jgi:hypothetical protein
MMTSGDDDDDGYDREVLANYLAGLTLGVPTQTELDAMLALLAKLASALLQSRVEGPSL